MKSRLPGFRIAPVVMAISLAASALAASGETLQTSSVESRVLLGFDVPDAALAGFLPEGWKSVPFPKGPLAGADCVVSLVDRELEKGADGKPLDPPKSQSIGMLTLASNGGPPRVMVFRVYSSKPGEGAYGNSVQADTSFERMMRVDDSGAQKKSLAWRTVQADGGAFEVSLDFAPGMAAWVSEEVKPFSSVDPENYRIYRYDRLIELLSSTPLGKPLSGDVSVSVSIAELAEMFDGSESLVAIMDVPVYVLDVFLP
ncbi:hypothetical protein [Aliiruegeria lutimaris]|uniref:Complex I intermediate-associated protein 30 (CIA30) n=1 Tax=Aliiruegeria lutimaris TaxID=571298 RepID=A0A1G9ELQ8_9RHOB|nr:hypothetical protein [Aliiruegeria lutimaris]SDK77056.1 hypothetical protein SAMN04488026_105322 [Aliiruegeria lutimaris]